MSESVEHAVGSGNVFADLGFDEPEEELAKAEIVIQLVNVIRGRGLTQAHAARILGINQPRVLALMGGNVEEFSLERLIRLLLALDKDVSIVVESKRQEHGHLSVVAR